MADSRLLLDEQSLSSNRRDAAGQSGGGNEVAAGDLYRTSQPPSQALWPSVSGRYKSLVIDERGGDYLRTACDYVHLNPFRAGLIAPEQPLSAYAWSSYALYLVPARRPAWLRVDRLLGEHGIQTDDAEGRIEFQRRLEDRRRENETTEQ